MPSPIVIREADGSRYRDLQPNIRRSSGNPMKWGQKGKKEQQMSRTAGEHGPWNQLSSAHRFTETEAAIAAPDCVCTRSSVHMLLFLAWGACEIPNRGNVGVSLTLLPAYETLFLLLYLSPSLAMRACSYSYCIFLLQVRSLGVLLFLEGK